MFVINPHPTRGRLLEYGRLIERGVYKIITWKRGAFIGENTVYIYIQQKYFYSKTGNILYYFFCLFYKLKNVENAKLLPSHFLSPYAEGRPSVYGDKKCLGRVCENACFLRVNSSSNTFALRWVFHVAGTAKPTFRFRLPVTPHL